MRISTPFDFAALSPDTSACSATASCLDPGAEDPCGLPLSDEDSTTVGGPADTAGECSSPEISSARPGRKTTRLEQVKLQLQGQGEGGELRASEASTDASERKSAVDSLRESSASIGFPPPPSADLVAASSTATSMRQSVMRAAALADTATSAPDRNAPAAAPTPTATAPAPGQAMTGVAMVVQNGVGHEEACDLSDDEIVLQYLETLVCKCDPDFLGGGDDNMDVFE